MRKFILILFFLFLASFFYNRPAFASENFDTSYNVFYDVSPSGSTRVTLNIGLTNKTSKFYASSYGVQTGFEDISNVRVTDGTGELIYKAEKNDDGTQITFDFNEKTVGINNTQRFSIAFDTHEIAKNFGSVWEVNIPGVSNQSDYLSFNVVVRTPENIGFPSIIKPASGSFNSENNSLSFSKKELGNGGIAIAYGDHQSYKFDIDYHIQNKNVFPETTEIAIPSDNAYQKVRISDINPKPLNVVVDEDGNWLARYRLLPSQKLDIHVSGFARISYHPKSEALTEVKKKIYLKSDEYWEASDPEIKKLANELKTPRNIYDYVVKNLKYDTGRIKEVQVREGAKGVLLDKTSAVCLEFTDLFVTLTRAAGIPARAVEGYANTSNSADRPLSLIEDVLHAWPEYYDEKRKSWIMVDPTWGNTTKGIDYFDVLDFDHFAFVTKGVDSDYPIPAGGYKSSRGKDEKDVKITTVAAFPHDQPSVTVSTDFPQRFYGGFPIHGNIVISNDSPVIVEKNSFKVSVPGLTPESQNFSFKKIPPYGSYVIPINFKTLNPLTNKSFTVKIAIGNDVVTKDIKVEPFYKNTTFLIAVGGIILGTFLLIVSLFIYRSRRLHFPK